MNFQSQPILEPIKVTVINPLSPASQLIIVKIMSGIVFGNDQLIDLYLLVYINEIDSAKAFMLEIESCAFACTNSIKVSSDLPSAQDIDVFCFMTNFSNPNRFNFTDEEFTVNFDALHLIIKIGTTLSWSDDNTDTTAKRNICDKKRKPIFMADGLVALDILNSLHENLPSDILFCPTPITAIAKRVLGDYLKVDCHRINELLVWAANDEVFHVEVQNPLIVVDDTVGCQSQCKSDTGSRCCDNVQFSDSWMKKEFIKKVASSASKNPYGCIYRAAEFSKTLRDIWLTRTRDDGIKLYSNIGVISDGSLGTIKGYPYVLPIIIDKHTLSVNKSFVEDSHLKQEIKRINKAVKEHHQQLITYCKKFIEDVIIQQASKGEGDSVSVF